MLKSLVVRCCQFVSLLIALLLLTTNLSAAIRLDVFVGYDGILTQGGFFPVVFEVFNDGPGFKGLLELTPGQFGQGQVRQVPVELPTGTLKRIVIPVFSAQQYGSSRSEEHTSELQSHSDLVCRLLLEKKKKKKHIIPVRD